MALGDRIELFISGFKARRANRCTTQDYVAERLGYDPNTLRHVLISNQTQLLAACSLRIWSHRAELNRHLRRHRAT